MNELESFIGTWLSRHGVQHAGVRLRQAQNCYSGNELWHLVAHVAGVGLVGVYCCVHREDLDRALDQQALRTERLLQSAGAFVKRYGPDSVEVRRGLGLAQAAAKFDAGMAQLLAAAAGADDLIVGSLE